MSVTVKTKGKIVLDVNAALDFVASNAISMIQRRTAKGIDSNGAPFQPYSPLYALQLQAVGEKTNVDLTRSGAYLAGISERSRTVTADRASVVIGPGTGSSPAMPLPPPYVFDEHKTPEQRAEAFAEWKSAPKKAGRSPPHPVLGAYLEKGTATMPARKHLGLTPDERKRLAERVAGLVIRQG